MSIELVMSSNHLAPFSSYLNLPHVRVFFNESALQIWCQSIGALASASVLPMNIQGWFPLGLTGLISLLSSSIQFSHSDVSDSLQRHGLQHVGLSCPPPTAGACSNSCPLSRWYHPAISSSVVPFSSCLPSFWASGSFLRSQFFASGGQSIEAWASASGLPMNIWIDFL